MKNKRCYFCNRVARKEVYQAVKAKGLSSDSHEVWDWYKTTTYITNTYQFEERVDFIVCHSCGDKIFNKNFTWGIANSILGSVAAIGAILFFVSLVSG